jgi:hypothetical protein
MINLAEPDDMVLNLGAGSVSQLGPMVLEQLRKKQAQMKEAASY